MSDQNEALDILINDFISMVESSTLIFERKFGTRDIRRLWYTKIIKRRGRVTRGVKYELHGVGCRINLSTGSVDLTMAQTVKLMGLILGAYTILPAKDHLNIGNIAMKKSLKKNWKNILI